ncbi:energy transducer TonB, partial [candidate division KSB1 bacterium]
LQVVPEEEKRLVFEIVESNPDAEIDQPDEDAEFASDRNTRARDFNLENAIANRAQTANAFDSKELPVPPLTSEQLNMQQQLKQFQEFDRSKIGAAATETKETQQQRQQSQQVTMDRKTALPDFQDFSARDIGGFSLSTYAWDFAPYMLELKRKIERNIHPPTAFSMGLIDGTYTIRFVIDRSGSVVDMKILDSTGSKALETTSYNAVRYSTPFRPLPEDFPDDVLVVTGRFQFRIIR